MRPETRLIPKIGSAPALNFDQPCCKSSDPSNPKQATAPSNLRTISVGVRRDGNGIPQKSFAVSLVGGSTHASGVGGGMGGELGKRVGTVKFGKGVGIGGGADASRPKDLIVAIVVIAVLVIVVVGGSSSSRRRFRLFLSNPTQEIVPPRRLLSVPSGSGLGEDGFLSNSTQEIAPSQCCCLWDFFFFLDDLLGQGHERFGQR